MKDLEKNVMCVLLQRLLDKNLITQDIHGKARQRILDTLDEDAYFCYAEGDRKEESHGYTQNPC